MGKRKGCRKKALEEKEKQYEVVQFKTMEYTLYRAHTQVSYRISLGKGGGGGGGS